MGSKYRRAFTMAELAIGVLLILIIGGPVVMTFRSGIELYTKTEANAEVTNGVRFTVDSFNRRISPMLDHTSEISVLLDPTIPDPVPKNDNYLFLLNNRVVHRDISGDHFLEGSEHISGLTFTVPSSAVLSPDNYLLEIALNGSYKTAILDVDAKQPLYNIPVKDGDNIVSDNYVGNVIYFKTPGAHDMSISFDVYDNATKIKINNSLMPKGTVILASYDLNITRNGIEVSYTDESSLDWYISGTTGSQREISNADVVADPSIRNNYQFLLVDDDNKPITVNTFDTKGYGTPGDFYIRTGTNTKTVWGPFGVIRARLSPAATTSRGKKITGEPVWSPYVEIGNKTFWETWLDAISGVPTDGFYNTNIGLDVNKVQLAVITATEDLKLGIKKSAKIKAAGGAFTVARLDYKYFDNDRLYSIWKNRPESYVSDTIPALMTVTNYSVLVNMKLNDIAMFGLSLSNTPNTTDGTVGTNLPFNDLGYAVIMSEVDKDNKLDDINAKGDFEKGIFIQAMDGTTIDNNAQTTFKTRGIQNCYFAPNNVDYNGNAYSPAHVQNTKFIYTDPTTWWRDGYHRVLYTVLEYYDRVQGKTRPRYIIRVRLLKQPAELGLTESQLAVLKESDPWFTGPEFFASEPMWFGDFVGDTIADNKTVDVRRYNSPAVTTVSSPSDITNETSDRFYGLIYSSVSETISKIIKKVTMDLYTDARESNTGLTDNRISLTDRDRYLGMMVYIKTPKADENAWIDIYDINLVPGFTADEIRSLLPANGKLYSVDETVIESRRPTADNVWYEPGALIRNYNDALFGTDGYSDGSGNNGSRYNSTAPGILGLQHVPGTCTCPLDNEVFKWIK